MASARIADLTSENVQRALAQAHRRKAGHSRPQAIIATPSSRSPSGWMRLTGPGRTCSAEWPVSTSRKIRDTSGGPSPSRRLRRLDRSGPSRRTVQEHDGADAGALLSARGCVRAALTRKLAQSSPSRSTTVREPATVTIRAAYAKNSQTVALPIAPELAADLAGYVAALEPRKPIFPLPHDKGAAMLRKDLEAAGIAYQDDAGLFFDFHSLRCETATLADAAGVSPRVVQRMMRHSKLEMTGRYTRPRAVDMESAASMLPSLRPTEDETESLAATGTDGRLGHRVVSEGSTSPPEDPGKSGRPVSISGYYFAPTKCLPLAIFRDGCPENAMAGSTSQPLMKQNP